MARIARTPAEVIASEISYRSPETSWADALAIASVVSNRALALGVTQAQVVGTTQEFNAYGGAMPAGAKVDLAQRAIDDVAKFGPTTAATFYAMPRAIDNLPPTKEFDMAVDGGHMYFTEPTGGAIKTKVGYRAPVDIATVNAAAAQRKAYEAALVDEDNTGIPTPGMRPGTLNISQNPALLAGAPLSQIDPNIAFGVADPIGGLPAPSIATAQQLQPSDAMLAEQQITSPQALQAALSNLGAGMTAQRDFMPTVEVTKGARPGSMDMSRFGEEVGPVANRVKTTSIPAQINSPQALSDALSVAGLEQGMDAQRTTAMPSVDVAKGSRIGQSEMPSVDVAKSSRIGSIDNARFGDEVGPVAHSVKTSSFPGAIDSPQALAAALGNFPAAMAAQRETIAAPAMAEAAAVKGDRIGGIDTSGVDTSRLGPDAIQTADAALKDAIDRAQAPSTTSALSDRPAYMTEPAKGVFSQNNVGRLMTAAEEQANREIAQKIEAPMFSQTSVNSIPGLANEKNPYGLDPMVALNAQPANIGEVLAEKAVPNIVTPSIPASSQAPASSMTPQQIAGYQEAAKTMAQAGMLNIGQQPPTDLSGNLPTDFNVLAQAPDVVPAPSMETVDVAPQPTVATPVEVEEPAPALEQITVPDAPPVEAVTPAVTTSVPSVTKSMPAVQARQSSAMDVWGGKAQTGVATDGSTVSRVSSNRIGRYVPEFDYTVFSQDDGATWSNPIAGNKLTVSVAPSVAPSVQPATNQSLIGRLMSVLTGQVPTAVSPTDIGPTMGLDGGMSIGRDGPAGAPGGWGPGGSITSPGSAGGYGSTNGVDPNSR
jgi:hypothetical protein